MFYCCFFGVYVCFKWASSRFFVGYNSLGFGVFCIYSTPCICSSFYPAWCVLHGLEVIILIV
uniref:Uncharacterized protein n=1 Tax=Medicago truncatula TaxID=3880 RepID=I3SRR3_MEDTR|nr:unknown [Medicago truncatula]